MAPEEDHLRGNADDLADLAGNEVVVAGQDLHGDPVVLERLDRCHGGLLRWIQKGDVAREDQLRLVVLRIGLAGLEVAVRQRQHAESVVTQRFVLFPQILDEHVVDGIDVSIQLEAAAALEDLFGRTLADEPVHPLRRLDHHGHQAPGEVERDFIDFPPVLERETVVQPMLEHGAIEHVLEARLEVAVQIGEREHTFVSVAGDIAVALEEDVVLCEGAGLVGAEDVHRAEVLDGVEPLDDDALA